MYAACKDGNIIKWNLHGLTKPLKSNYLPSIQSQQKKGNKFGRKALNEDGSIMI